MNQKIQVLRFYLCAGAIMSVLPFMTGCPKPSPPPPTGPQARVGSIPGSLTVSDSGAAVYSVPLRIPPGIGGAVPSLSLTYSSQGGDGFLGVGWMLDGISTITRCPKTLAIDEEIHGIDFSSNDAYCLDGQRLIEIPPTGGANREFRAQNEQFAKIEAFGTAGTGPSYFLVSAPNGIKREYGATDDSRIEAVPDGNSVRAYAVNKQTDLSGNYYTVHYDEDAVNGAFYPDWITYSANDAASQDAKVQVAFEYEPRPAGDAMTFDRYIGTSTARTTERLVKIVASVKDSGGTFQRVTRYTLDYGSTLSARNRSQLRSIEECGFDESNAEVCKPKTTFDWDQGIAGFDSPGAAQLDTLFQGQWQGFARYSGDYDGDGVSDILLVSDGDIRFCSGKNIANGVGCGNPNATSTGTTWASDFEIFVGDFDGDGKTDIFRRRNQVNEQHFCRADNITSMFVPGAAAGTPCVQKAHQWLPHEDISLGDVDGDGRTDMVRVSHQNQWFCPGTEVIGGGSCTMWSDYRHWGNSTPQYLADFNGDGRSDFLKPSGDAPSFCDSEILSTPGAGPRCTVVPMNRNWGYFDPRLGDFNGDGYSDIYLIGDVETWFCAGPGIANGDNCVRTSTGGGWKSNYDSYTGDFNGDGATDIALVHDDGGDMCLGPHISESFSCVTVLEEPGLRAAVSNLIPGDFDGDGMPDILYVEPVCLTCPRTEVVQHPISASGGHDQSDYWHPDMARDGQGGHAGSWKIGNDSRVVFADLGQVLDWQVFVVHVDDPGGGSGGESMILRETGTYPDSLWHFDPTAQGLYVSEPQFTGANHFDVVSSTGSHFNWNMWVGDVSRRAYVLNPPAGHKQTGISAFCSDPENGTTANSIIEAAWGGASNNLLEADNTSETSVEFAPVQGDFVFQRVHLFLDAGNSGSGAEVQVLINDQHVFGNPVLGKDADEITADYYGSGGDGHVEIVFDTDVDGDTIVIRNQTNGTGQNLHIEEVQREVFVKTYANDTNNHIKIVRGRQGPAGVIKRVHVGVQVDGSGNDYAIEYAPLSNMQEQVYVPGTGAAYPLRDTQHAGYVVKRLTMPDGLGTVTNPGSYTVDYTYEGLRISAEQRRSVGFARIQSDDSRTSLRSERYLVQDPLEQAGLAYLEQVIDTRDTSTTADDAVLRRTTTQWTSLPSDSSCAQCKHPVSWEVKVEAFEPNGTPNPPQTTTRTTTASIWDTYGNAEIVTTSVENHVDQIEQEYWTQKGTTYFDDTELWVLGQPSTRLVTVEGPYDDHSVGSRFTSFQYQGGLLSQTTNPVGTVTDYERDDPRGLVTKTIVTGFVVSEALEVEFESRESRVEYDSYGLPDKLYNALDHMTDIDYDPRLGVMTRAEDPNGVHVVSKYDAFGRLLQTLPQVGAQTTVQYKDCLASQCPRFPEARLRTITSTGGQKPIWTFVDALGRPVGSETKDASTPARTIVDRVTYDALGRPTEQTRPFFSDEDAHITRTTYDILGRPLTVTTPGDGDRTVVIDYDPLKITRTLPDTGDTLTRTTKTHSDSSGSVWKVVDAANRETRYLYDGFGQVHSVTNPENLVTTMEYDALGRRTFIHDPSLGSVRDRYTGFGEVWARQFFNNQGRHQQMTYDALGRMKRRIDTNLGEVERSWSWTYDPEDGIGGLDEVTDDALNYRRRHFYDGFGRPSAVQVTSTAPASSGVGQQSAIVGMHYDEFGRIQRTDYPGLPNVEREYAADGTLKRIYKAGTAEFTFWEALERDELRRVTRSQHGNGLQTIRTHNPVTSELESIFTGNGAQNFAYEYDTLGNVTERQDFGPEHIMVENYGYDVLNRLAWSHVGGQSRLYQMYGAAGNVTCMRSTDPIDCGAGHGARISYKYRTHQVEGITHDPISGANVNGTSGLFSAGFTYDGDGNQVSRTGAYPRTIEYNSFNKPSSITNGTVTSEYAYGADRDLVWRHHGSEATATTTFTPLAGYDQWHTPGSIEHRITIGTPDGTKVVYKTDDTTAAFDSIKVSYVHADHLGSSSSVTNHARAVVERYAFDAYGRHRDLSTGVLVNPETPPEGLQVSSRTTDSAYTGQRQEPGFNLYNYGARMYDPTIGRFLQPDPVVQAPLNAENLNRYAYVVNNPMRYNDPTGNRFSDVTGLDCSVHTACDKLGDGFDLPGIGEHSHHRLQGLGNQPGATGSNGFGGSCRQFGYQGSCSYTVTILHKKPGARSASSPVKVVASSGDSTLGAFVSGFGQGVGGGVWDLVRTRALTATATWGAALLFGAAVAPWVASAAVVGGLAYSAYSLHANWDATTSAIGDLFSGELTAADARFAGGLLGGMVVDALGGQNRVNATGKEGKAVVRGVPGNSPGDAGHVSVEIIHGSRSSSSHLVYGDRHRDGGVFGSIEVPGDGFQSQAPLKWEVDLPDAEAALRYQKSVVGTEPARYEKLTNSCVTHVCDVLSAGGRDVPTGDAGAGLGWIVKNASATVQ